MRYHRFMRNPYLGVLTSWGLLLSAVWLAQLPGRASAQAQTDAHALVLRMARSSPLDLELGGDLANVPPDATR